MKAVVIAIVAMCGLSACATNRLSDAERLDIYKAHAGEPVSKIRNFSLIDWQLVDDEHVVLRTKPNESWLLTVAGPCLDMGGASPSLGISSSGAYIMSKFDRILVKDSGIDCMIQEIRPVDVKAVRAAQEAAQAQASSGT